MVEDFQQFGSLSIAHRAGGAPVELERSKDEIVFLAFDNRIRRLVELHVLRGGSSLDAAAKRSAFDRAKQASEIRNPTFMRILELGEDEGLVYYTSNLNDGEFAESYVKRRGATTPLTSLALVFQLLDDLLQLKGCERLVSRMRIERVLVTTLEDTFLQLRVVDYGLSLPDEAQSQSGGRLVVEACKLLFLLLTGQPYQGENPDRFTALTQLPMSLRTTMRTALSDPGNAPTSIEKLRDDVREACSALASSAQSRMLRKNLVVNPSLLPVSQLQDMLLENVPVENILGTRFRVENAEHVRRYPFSIPATNAKSDQPVMVHLLPPSRIVDKARYEAVPLQMWRFNPERHPNILRSLSLWESPDWTFLTEEREPGFALSRLMAERITLNPAEVTVLMRQICAGLDQAVECGVQRIDLHPSNILLRVGKQGPLLSRELERLMQKRLDAWPPFLVKLRPHTTMRSLYEPLLVDMDIPDGALQEEHLLDRDFRHRSFVSLTAYLLTGERQSGGALHFPESVPEAAATYVRECVELARRAGKAPAPGDFIDKFESLLSAPTVDLAVRLRGHSVAIEEMESVGTVSDFDEDWQEADNGDETASGATPFNPRRIKTHDFNSVLELKRRVPLVALLAAAVVVLGLGVWFLMGGGSDTSPPQQNTTASASAEGPVDAVDVQGAPKVKSTASSVPPVELSEEKPKKAPLQPPPQLKTPEKSSDSSKAPSVLLTEEKPDPAPKRTLADDDKPSVETAESSKSPPSPNSDKKPDVIVEPGGGKEKKPVTIRRAILPTQQELDRMKQGHVENRTGAIPEMSTASPLPRKTSVAP